MKMLLTMSAYGSAIIIITFILRIFFIKKLPKKAFKILWLLAAVRMLLPVFISVRVYLPLVPLKNNNEYTSEYYSSVNNAEHYQSVSEFYLTVHEVDPGKINPDVFLVVWIVGTIILILFFSAAYIRGIRKYKNAEVLENLEIAKIIYNAGLQRKVTVLESKNADTFYKIAIAAAVCILSERRFAAEENAGMLISLNKSYLSMEQGRPCTGSYLCFWLLAKVMVPKTPPHERGLSRSARLGETPAAAAVEQLRLGKRVLLVCDKLGKGRSTPQLAKGYK